MTSGFGFLFRGLNAGLLGCAALLVPGEERQEWLKEWRAELWHVRQARTPAELHSWRGEHEVASFCLGAFQDAFCLRSRFAAERVRPAAAPGSPMHCLLCLAAVAALGAGIALLLPGVRAQLRPSHYRFPPGLMLIQDARQRELSVPAVAFAEYERWRQQRRLFADSAYFQVIREPVSGAGGVRSIAHATTNLFDLLRIPVSLATDTNLSGGKPQLILSETLWRTKFGADPGVAGRLVRVGGVEAVVAGVAAPDSWKLSKNLDAWLLEPDAELARPAGGFVIARLSPRAQWEWYGTGRHAFARSPDGLPQDLLVEPLAGRTQGPWGTLLFAMLLALLALPATTPLSLGEYPIRSSGGSRLQMLRRWSFLGCKIAAVLAIACCCSLDLTYLRETFDWRWSEYVQVSTGFCVSLLGLRWALRDQRRRCPVCLRTLTHPARVGQPSRNFLAWNGTELMCTGGHGLMHVPELPTSWFATQRWLHLDRSWDVLFADAGT